MSMEDGAVALGQEVKITINGGTPPYKYEVIAPGGGTITVSPTNPRQAVYKAAAPVGTTQLRVTDAKNIVGKASIIVQ